MSRILVLYYSSYGHAETLANVIVGGDASRQRGENELTIARFQGQHVAEQTNKLAS